MGGTWLDGFPPAHRLLTHAIDTYIHVPHVHTTRPPASSPAPQPQIPPQQLSSSQHRSGKTESLHRVNVPSVQITSHGRGYRIRWLNFSEFTPCASPTTSLMLWSMPSLVVSGLSYMRTGKLNVMCA